MTNQPGLTLADLAAMSEDVPVGTSFITVQGISAANAIVIFKRFPKLLNLINGFDLKTFIEAAPEAAAAIIATATGNGDDFDAEVDAGKIALEIQYDILEAVGRLTFKSGFGPFVEKITAMGATRVPAFGSSGKEQDTKSQPQSKPSSQPDIPQT